MADESKDISEFTGQADSYIKFLIYHFAIVLTIVFSLYSAVKKVSDEDVQSKVEEVTSLRKITGDIPLEVIKDNLIKGMYFGSEDTSSSIAVVQDTSNGVPVSATVNSAQDTTTASGTDSIKKSTTIKETARARQQVLLKEIEKISKDAFQLRLTFLGDAQVDLRIWVFVLPFVFFLSCIYIFILDFKISVIKKLALIPTAKQYPFNFLRSLFLFGEVFLVAFYVYIILLFFEVQQSAIKNFVLYAIVFFMYYGLVYCIYFTEMMRSQYKDIKPLRLFVNLAKLWNWITKNLSRINPFAYLGTGQALAIVTLFLVMTEGCDSKDISKTELKKGYQMVIDPGVYWELFTENYQSEKEKENSTEGSTDNEQQQELLQLLLLSGVIVGKYLYTGIIVLALLSVLWYRKKRKRVLFMPASFFIITSLFVFTIFFGLYFLFPLPTLSFPISLVCLLYWYFSFYKRTEETASFGRKHLKGLVVFLLPLVILSIRNTIKITDTRNGWFFFFLSLWMFVLAMTYMPIAEEKQ